MVSNIAEITNNWFYVFFRKTNKLSISFQFPAFSYQTLTTNFLKIKFEFIIIYLSNLNYQYFLLNYIKKLSYQIYITNIFYQIV